MSIGLLRGTVVVERHNPEWEIIAKDTIEKLMSGQQPDPEKKESNGIGMDNVIARLKLFSENEDVFDISSEGEGKGTKFTIYLKKGGDN